MATTNLGRIGFVAKGDYAAGTYKYLDLVRYSGAAYVCKIASTTALPTDTSAWDLILQDTGALNSGSPTNITGILKGAAGALSAASSTTDYQIPITGGATTITTSNLTASKALTSDASGKVAASTATSTELGYLSGVTSAIQTQIGAKQATLVNQTNISSINGTSLLLGGNLTVTASGLNSGGTTNINGLFKGNGSTVSAATAGTDYAGIGIDNAFTADQTIHGVKIGVGSSSTNNNITVGIGGSPSLASGTFNAIIGYSCCPNLAGDYNTVIGSGALWAVSNATTNDFNTAIGSNALSSLVSYTNCTGLGYNAQVAASNQVQAGDSATGFWCYGAVNNRSDIRDKTDIRDTVLGLNFIQKLRPVDYVWDYREDYRPKTPEPIVIPDDATDEEKAAVELENKTAREEWCESVKLKNLKHDGTHKRKRYHHGLIAQDVQALIKETGVDFGGFKDVSFDGEGDDVLGIGYEELIAPLIKAVQELSARVVELENAR